MRCQSSDCKKLDPGIAVEHQSCTMNKIIDALESERARIDKALRILRGETAESKARLGRLSLAARARISEAQSILRGETTESKARLDRLSPAARARISKAQKARWKQYRKQQAA
jgi:hypothetical protein